jgi:hypothetical protein
MSPHDLKILVANLGTGSGPPIRAENGCRNDIINKHLMQSNFDIALLQEVTKSQLESFQNETYDLHVNPEKENQVTNKLDFLKSVVLSCNIVKQSFEEISTKKCSATAAHDSLLIDVFGS